MKQNKPIRDAIDESLSGVRFNAQDMRTVLRTVRREPAKPARSAHKRHRRLDLAFAAAALVLVIAPVSVILMHAQDARPVSITSIGDATPTPDVLPLATPAPTAIAPTASPDADPIVDAETVPPLISITQEEAIRIARECFEAQCDTNIFTFEEYAVSALLSVPSEGCAQYTVRMECIYDNGCRFIVVISADDGSIIQYSSPSLATQASANNAE